MAGVNVAQSDTENVIKTGYLKKGRQSNRISSAFKRTPRRWFVYGVRDGTLPFLEYYEDEESTFTSVPINSFDLTGCKKITYVLAPRNPSLTFCIVLQDRTIELTALTRTDLIDWCDRMECSLRQLGCLESLRGPDDEHVYVDAPFLQKGYRPRVTVQQAEGEGAIHSTASEVLRVTLSDPDQPEDVPGMIYLPSISRNRPMTINALDSSTSMENGGSLERKLSRVSVSREHRMSLERGPSLDSFLVEEKENRSEKHPLKGLVRRSTIAVPRRRVEAVNSKLRSIGLVNGMVNRFDLDTEGHALLLDDTPKPKDDVSSAYGNLSDWTSITRSNNNSSMNSDSPRVTCNNNDNHDEMVADSSLGFCKKDENDNHTGLRENLGSSESQKHKLSISISCPKHCEDSQVDTECSQQKACVSPACPVGSLRDCLPDDEQVRHNVQQLLKFFDSSEVCGSGEQDHEETGTLNHETGLAAGATTTYGESADDDFKVFESLVDLGLALPPEPAPPEVPEGESSSKLSSCNAQPDLKNRSAHNQSPDMGYVSDKSPAGAEGCESTLLPTSDGTGTDALPERKKKDRVPGETDAPPPLPVRPANLGRVRPVTVYPGKGTECAPEIPPRRSLSVMQQVSNRGRAQSVVPLKMSQVELFRNNITSPVAKPVELRRRDCLGTIAFVDAYGSVWIAGWNQRARPRLHALFHLGDRLVSINNEPVRSAAAAQKFIKHCPNEHLVLEVKTAPKAKVVCIQRSSSCQSLGFKRDGGTAEIIYIDPHGLAARHGLSCRAPTMDNSGSCNWVLTEINSRPLDLFLKKDEITQMLSAVGLDISIVVQPVDFIGALKRQLKHLKNYKDYLLP